MDLFKDHKYSKNILFSLGLVILFCVFSYYFIDKPVAIYFKSSNYNVFGLFDFITKFGVSTWYLVISFCAFLFYRYVINNKIYSNQALFVFLSIAVSGLLADLIKLVFGRYRPNMFFDKGLYDFTFFKAKYAFNSFPSGHANTITALTLALYFLYPTYRNIYIIVAISVILSRLVLCSHFVSDVVFGAYLAILTTLYLRNYFDEKGIPLLSERIGKMENTA
ncbi:phosphatase PAP2 family protein [Desulforhabdus amnigena]|jgi:membrane-associated phospholipid phosphatase|nr:phosphatase PAP2 family protein [Desulforhabdus amnigena]NLJ29195.1 phosphatase PAP2 family protein [Deltaproteobacteria bacterium]